MGVNYLSKKRLYELAKELGLSSKELIAKAKEININVNNHMSNIDRDEEKLIRDLFAKKEEKREDKKNESRINESVNVKIEMYQVIPMLKKY